MADEDKTQSKPINIRLKEKCPTDILRLKPRRYQIELCQKALKQNVIIYLGTGLGKTFITVLYLTNPKVDEQVQDGKRIVFLAPTVDLVKQQAEYINRQVRYRVKIFCGRSAHLGEQIDMWSKDIWTKELNMVDILFMTPQIFASAISTNLLDWSQFAAIIFDEVHHACRISKSKESGHPYKQIISSYNDYFKIWTHERPRLIGLTASLINSMPKDRESIKEQVRYLELILNARCVTDIGVHDTKPKMIIYCYEGLILKDFNDILCGMFRDCSIKFEETLKIRKVNNILKMKNHELSKNDERTKNYFNRLKLAAAGFSIKPHSFPKVLQGLEKIRKYCGLWHVRAICDRLIEALEKHDKNAFLKEDLKMIYNRFTCLIRIMKASLSDFLKGYPLQGLIKFTRPKCLTLLEILKSEYKRALEKDDSKSTFSCIIFVRSRLEVLALNLWIQHVSCELEEYNFIKCDYAIGIAATMSSKYSCITKRKSNEQYKMLDNFRKGYLNVIVTTSVLEEGIDLPTCSTVIRYDQPNTFREYVQSRGRARQTISSFIFLTDYVDHPMTSTKLDKFNDFELALKSFLNSDSQNIRSELTPFKPTIKRPPEEVEDYLLLNENKVRIESSTAKTLLNMYCQGLAKHTPYSEGVTYERFQLDGLYQTTLFLPSGCPLNSNGIMGNKKSTPLGADNSAVVLAVKALHDAEELDYEHVIPTRLSDEKIYALLDQLHLKPDYDLLEKQIETKEKIVIKETEYFLFKPKMAQIDDCITKNSNQRTYKLLRLNFVPIESQKTRIETKKYFEKSVFGIIVDSATPNDFIRDHLFSHYGQFKAKLEQINDNLTINQREHHNEYLNYTYKLLTRCLFISNLKKEDFRYHALFHIVLLDKSNNPDVRRMRNSFINTGGALRVGCVAKLRYYYRGGQTYRDRDDNKLFLIRNIHDRNYFIRDDRARRVYGEKFHNYRSDNVVELMPLSREYATGRVMKAKRQLYSTNSVFYPESVLEFFNEDPSEVFQAYNLPEQIFNLYKLTTTLELEKDFLNNTKDHREIKSLKIFDPPMELKIDNLPPIVDEIDDYDGGDEIVQQLPFDKEEFDITENEIDNSSISSNDTEFTEDEDDDEELIGKEYKDLISRKKFDFDGQEDIYTKWDLSTYTGSTYLHKDIVRSSSFGRLDEYSAFQSEHFARLRVNISEQTNSLCLLIENFQHHLVADGTFLDEELEFKKREAIVDQSIISELKFDKANKPFKGASTSEAMLEALTQTRALESYNLESLENIGDSYLKYITTVILYQNLEGNEGFLTSARSRLICNKHFTLLARKKNLGSYAITRPQSKDFISYILGSEMKDNNKKQELNNKIRAKHLADLFESLIGSYLLYRGEYEAILAIRWLGFNLMINDKTFSEFHEKSVAFSKGSTALLESNESNIFYRSCKRKMNKFEEIIGYKFQDPSYLIQAFTHPSNAEKCTRSYERLEFLGDAVLDYLVTMNLVVLGSIKSPGQVTSSREALVNNVSFAKLSIKYKYDLFLQHGSSDLYDELSRLRIDIEEDPEMSYLDMNDFDKIVKLLGDIFESVAGAIFLDSGCSLDKVWSVYYPMMKESIDNEIKCPTINVVRKMYETFPGKNRILYEVYDVKTEDISLVGVKCEIVGYGEFHGKGLSKKQAKLRAVQEAMKNLPSEEVLKRLNKNFLEQYGDVRINRKRVGGGGGGDGNAGAYFRPRGGHNQKLRQNYNNNSNPNHNSNKRW